MLQSIFSIIRCDAELFLYILIFLKFPFRVSNNVL